MEVGEGEPSNTCRGLQRRSYAMSVSSQREGGVRVTVCVFGVRRWRGKGGGRGRLGIVCIFRQIPGFQRLPGSTGEASSDTRCFTLYLEAFPSAVEMQRGREVRSILKGNE